MKHAGFEGGQMPLARRLPKVGFNNIFATQYAIVNVLIWKLLSMPAMSSIPRL